MKSKMIKGEEDLQKFKDSEIFKQFEVLPLGDKEILIGLFSELVYKEKQKQQNHIDNQIQKQPSQYLTQTQNVPRATSQPAIQHQQKFNLKQKPMILLQERFITPQEEKFFLFIKEKLNDWSSILKGPLEQFTLIQKDDYQQKQQSKLIIVKNNQKADESFDKNKQEMVRVASNSGILLSEISLKKNQNEKPEDTSLINKQTLQQQEIFLYYDEFFNSKKELVMRLKFNSIDQFKPEPQTIIPYKFLLDKNIKSMNETFYQFNTRFGKKEINILQLDSLMVNSNIINAYVNHLMVEDERKYFLFSERSKYQRLLIFGSDFITDCALDKNIGKKQQQEKQLYLWLKYLENFKAIQYQIWLIYKKIGFVVNIGNSHWYFIQIIFENKLIVVYDSMRCISKRSYEDIRELFSFLFSAITRQEKLQFDLCISTTFEQQKDGLSCGYYTCIAANFLYESGLMKSLDEIKNILRNLLLQQDENNLIQFNNE